MLPLQHTPARISGVPQSVTSTQQEAELASDDNVVIAALKEKYPGKVIIEWKVSKARQSKTCKTVTEYGAYLGLTGSSATPARVLPSTPAPVLPSTSAPVLALTSVLAPTSAPTSVLAPTSGLLRAGAGSRAVGRKRHLQVSAGGHELQINNVSIGDKQLNDLEKFNLYSWRALGHKVTIYSLRYDEKEASASLLGLDEGDATVIDIRHLLATDNMEVLERGPKADLKGAMSGVRETMNRWAKEIVNDVKPYDTKIRGNMDAIYNMVDATKSYLGGTQRGIVLDMKVGPSMHVQDYATTMYTDFISYSRGSNAFTVENQSMGSMNVNDAARMNYGREFNSRMEAVKDLKVNSLNTYNQITGYHGGAWQRVRGRDVSKQLPTGVREMSREYEVEELDGFSQGPFRIYKAKDDQSHKDKDAFKIGMTVPGLMSKMYREEFSTIDEDNIFIHKMKRIVIPEERKG